MQYSDDRTGEKGSPDYFQTTNFSVQWSHTQDPKSRPGTTFRASVNFSSPSNNQYNTTNIQQGLQNQISSSISYGKTWAGSPFSLSLSALHSLSSRATSNSTPTATLFPYTTLFRSDLATTDVSSMDFNNSRQKIIYMFADDKYVAQFRNPGGDWVDGLY